MADPDALVQIPDPASRFGVNVRTIGYSAAFDALVTVITGEDDGVIYGVKAWRSNATDIRRYKGQE